MWCSSLLSNMRADLLEDPDVVAQPHVSLQVGEEAGELGVQILCCQNVGEHSVKSNKGRLLMKIGEQSRIVQYIMAIFNIKTFYKSASTQQRDKIPESRLHT
jgi:hypothetical protein